MTFRSEGTGTRYRAMIGPGLTPGVIGQGSAPVPDDAAADAQANDAQRELLSGESRCVVN